MKILIIDGLLDSPYSKLPLIFDKFNIFLRKIRLIRLIKSVKSIDNTGKKFQFTIYSNKIKEGNLVQNIPVNNLLNYRIDLPRKRYLQIKDEIKLEIKENLRILFNNFEDFTPDIIEGELFIKLFEIYLIRFYNVLLGRIEMINHLIKKDKYEKIILKFSRLENQIFENISNLVDLQKIIKFEDKLIINLEKSLYFSHFLIDFTKFLLFLVINYFKIKNKKKLNSSKDLALFVAYSKNHYKCLYPIYRKLKDKNHSRVDLFSLNKYSPIIFPLKIFYFSIRNRKFFLNKVSKLSEDLNYKGNDLTPSLELFFRRKLFFLLIKLKTTLMQFDRFVKKRKPFVVFLSNDEEISTKSISYYCKKNKIPTIYIPHAGIPIRYEPISTSDISFITIAGNMDFDYYINRGEPKEKLILTGATRYEKLFKGKIESLKKVHDIFTNEKYDFLEQEIKILLTTSPFDSYTNRKILETVIKSMKQLNLLNNLIIKIHPREDGLLHNRILKELNVKIPIVKNYNILNLIKTCDLLISTTSTTVLESMLLGTPVILLDFINWEFQDSHTYTFTNKKYVKTVNNELELIETIKDLLKDKKNLDQYRRSLLDKSNDFCFYKDNKSPTEYIMNLINKLKKCEVKK